MSTLPMKILTKGCNATATPCAWTPATTMPGNACAFKGRNIFLNNFSMQHTEASIFLGNIIIVHYVKTQCQRCRNLVSWPVLVHYGLSIVTHCVMASCHAGHVVQDCQCVGLYLSLFCLLVLRSPLSLAWLYTPLCSMWLHVLYAVGQALQPPRD